jgi:hypothetical protein
MTFSLWILVSCRSEKYASRFGLHHLGHDIFVDNRSISDQDLTASRIDLPSGIPVEPADSACRTGFLMSGVKSSSMVVLKQ